MKTFTICVLLAIGCLQSAAQMVSQVEPVGIYYLPPRQHVAVSPVYLPGQGGISSWPSFGANSQYQPPMQSPLPYPFKYPVPYPVQYPENNAVIIPEKKESQSLLPGLDEAVGRVKGSLESVFRSITNAAIVPMRILKVILFPVILIYKVIKFGLRIVLLPISIIRAVFRLYFSD